MGAETSRAETEKGRNLWGSNPKRAETSGNRLFSGPLGEVGLLLEIEIKMKSGALLPSNLPRVIDRSNLLLAASRLGDKFDRSMTLGITRQ